MAFHRRVAVALAPPRTTASTRRRGFAPGQRTPSSTTARASGFDRHGLERTRRLGKDCPLVTKLVAFDLATEGQPVLLRLVKAPSGCGWAKERAGRAQRPIRVKTESEAAERGRVAAVVIALVVSVAGVVTFTRLLLGLGDWVEGRDLSVVLPWALPALVASAVAAVASVAALRTRRGANLAMLSAAVVALALVALVLVNPSISHPVP